jgi:hypothetical protein
MRHLPRKRLKRLLPQIFPQLLQPLPLLKRQMRHLPRKRLRPLLLLLRMRRLLY